MHNAIVFYDHCKTAEFITHYNNSKQHRTFENHAISWFADPPKFQNQFSRTNYKNNIKSITYLIKTPPRHRNHFKTFGKQCKLEHLQIFKFDLCQHVRKLLESCKHEFHETVIKPLYNQRNRVHTWSHTLTYI